MAGLTPGEAAVMARYDSGATVGEIADEFGIPRRRAERLIGMYDVDPALDRQREALVRDGSRRLLARLRQAGGHR